MDNKVLKQANELLSGDRYEEYGDPIENFSYIRDVANAMLRRKHIKLDIEDVAMVLIALKIAREGNKHKEDNIVDAAAYLQLLEVMNNKINK